MMKHDLLGKDETQYNFKVGKTMVFYQQKEHSIMEKKRELAFNSHVCLIQSVFRAYRDRKDFMEMKRIRPKLEQALETRNINLLKEAIDESALIQYDMKLIRDAK